MAWTTADIPDLTGRTAVVTGANGGLGLETARALAGAGARVVMGARDLAKADGARRTIAEGNPSGSTEIVELDLASLESVSRAAENILERHGSIDILVNNAGLMAIPERRTVDGFEMQFGVNHLGHFALTARLMPALLAADSARVVTVTSTAHHFGRRVDPANPNLTGNYRPWTAYAQSKLANFHFALGLDKRLAQSGAPAASLVAHPGLSHTDLQTHSSHESGGFGQRLSVVLAARSGMSAARGALPQLRAATDPAARGGQMYAPRFINSGDPVRRPIFRRLGLEESIRILWEVSEELTGLELRVAGPEVVKG